jgi:cytochrome c biogenesis protein CcdA
MRGHVSGAQFQLGDDQNNTAVGLRLAIAAGFVVWLGLIGVGIASTTAGLNRDELLRVAVWGVAIVAGGLFLVYTWTVAAAITERERLRGTIKRALALADRALEEADAAAANESSHA